MNTKNARQLAARLRRGRTALRARARAAVDAGDGRAALPLLLELDSRFEPDRWVIQSLAEIHRWLRLPEQGLEYVRRHHELTGQSTLVEVHQELEREHERWSRNQARLANVRDRPDEALDHAVTAASVREPSTWTLRVLTDVAVAAGKPEAARPDVARMRSHRPDDDALKELEALLHV